VVTARFPKGKKELEISLFQSVVLLCFNRLDTVTSSISLSQIAEETKLEINELKRTLQSLACGIIGTRVLTKEPKGKDIEDQDRFFINEEFTNKMLRIKINTIQVNKKTHFLHLILLKNIMCILLH
jgi:cullin-4